jgi:hypothetical protein
MIYTWKMIRYTLTCSLIFSSIVFGIDIVEGMSFVACYELPFRTTGICYKHIIKGI